MNKFLLVLNSLYLIVNSKNKSHILTPIFTC